MITFKDWFQQKLNDKGFTIIQLAEETGLSRTILYYYLKEVNYPTPANMEKICSALSADLQEGMNLLTIKKRGRPFGSSKKWGEENISKKSNSVTPLESNISPEHYII